MSASLGCCLAQVGHLHEAVEGALRFQVLNDVLRMVDILHGDFLSLVGQAKCVLVEEQPGNVPHPHGRLQSVNTGLSICQRNVNVVHIMPSKGLNLVNAAVMPCHCDGSEPNPQVRVAE